MMSSDEHYFLHLLKKYLEGSITEQEEIELNDILVKDSDKIDLYNYLSQEEWLKNDLEGTALNAYERHKPKYIDNTEEVITQSRPATTRTNWYKIAAVVSFILLSIPLYFYISGADEATQVSQVTTISTGKGERKFFRLPDGSEIWLNGESKLLYDRSFGITHRNIKLIGEGYFAVAKNKQIPFILDAYGNSIEVIGTVFNVRAYPEESKVETSLLEGKIQLSVSEEKKTQAIELNPGDKVSVFRIIPNEAVAGRNEVEAARALSPKMEIKRSHTQSSENETSPMEVLWLENKLVFDGDPLEVMVKKMERWYNKTIIVKNEKLNDERFTGVFQEPDAVSLLQVIKDTGVDFNIQANQDTITIY